MMLVGGFIICSAFWWDWFLSTLMADIIAHPPLSLVGTVAVATGSFSLVAIITMVIPASSILVYGWIPSFL
jgi:hypothetical protein